MVAPVKLPVVLICENNQYAFSTPLSRQFAIQDIAERAAGYGFPGVIVDGNDVLGVYEVVREAVERARRDDGPTLIECKTMRMRGHAHHDDARYVPAELLEEWEKKDPIRRYEKVLQDRGLLTLEVQRQIEERVAEEVEQAQAFAEQSPLPDPGDLERGVYHEPGGYWDQDIGKTS
jgi:pyruvate dehydrogenase E1 component alpha subunit